MPIAGHGAMGHRVLCAGALLALTSCQTTVTSTQAVCTFSAVEAIGNTERLATGWRTGPIVAGTTSPLQPARVGGSSVERLVDVSEVALPGRPPVVRLIATQLNAPLGTTGPPVLAQSTTGTNLWINEPGPFRSGVGAWVRTSATRLGPQIRGCYVSNDGRAFLAFLRPLSFAGWSVGDIELWNTEPGPAPLSDPSVPRTPGAGRVGPFSDISCAGAEDGLTPNAAPTELHVCAVTRDGRIWHSIFNGSTWTPFGNVQHQTSNNGPANAVACAIQGRQLHLVAVVRRSGAWFVEHTIRAPSGAWRAWDSLMFASDGSPWTSGSSEAILDVAAGFCNAEGPMPSGPRETKRLNVAWITYTDLTIIERSRGIVEWVPGRSGSVSPALGLGPSRSDARLWAISITQMPFPP